METITTKSTSLASARVSDAVIRETSTTRLIFRPLIVDNVNNPHASVKGEFIFQKKLSKDQWADPDTIPLSSVKSGELYKLNLRSEETLRFFEAVSSLYEIHSKSGVPRGSKSFVQVSPQLETLSRLSQSEITKLLEGKHVLGTNLLYSLLDWALRLEDPTSVLERLVNLNTESLAKLNAAVGLQSLKRVLDIWEENRSNNDEEFWQKTLSESSFVLERVFSWPVSVVKGKAYIGGKSVMNSGGNIVDFLVKNGLTGNAALIEIKTPETNLLGARYRAGVFNVSSELSGSVVQILNYKYSLQNQHNALTAGQADLFESFDPQCVLIIGNGLNELNHQDKTRSFELFRNQLRGVRIITYDEVFLMVRSLIELLEGKNNMSNWEEDVPF